MVGVYETRIVPSMDFDGMNAPQSLAQTLRYTMLYFKGQEYLSIKKMKILIFTLISTLGF